MIFYMSKGVDADTCFWCTVKSARIAVRKAGEILRQREAEIPKIETCMPGFMRCASSSRAERKEEYGFEEKAETVFQFPPPV